MSEGRDHLSRAEIGKDALQSTAEAAATTVGEVVTIITGAVKDVASAVGGFATELFETVDASRKALAEHAEETAAVADSAAPDPEALDIGEPTPELDDPADPA